MNRGGSCLQTNPDFVFGPNQMDAIEFGEDKVRGMLHHLSPKKEIIGATQLWLEFYFIEKLSSPF